MTALKIILSAVALAALWGLAYTLPPAAHTLNRYLKLEDYHMAGWLCAMAVMVIVVTAVLSGAIHLWM